MFFWHVLRSFRALSSFTYDDHLTRLYVFFTRKLFILYLTSSAKRWINIFCIYLDCGRTGSCKRRHPKATNKKKYKLNASRTKYCSSIFYLPSSSGLEIIFRQCLQHFLFLESVNANCIMTRPIYCQRITSKRFILFFFKCKQMIKPAKTFNSDMK